MEDYTLEQVAYLYYYQGLSQQEIATYLKLSKMNVSRLLQKARESKVVRTSIDLPFKLNTELQTALCQTFNLNSAKVVKTEGTELKSHLAKVAAFYFINSLPHNRVYGMGVGESIGKMAQNLRPIETHNVHVVQLMGGVSAVSPANPLSIVQLVCEKLGSRGNYLTSLALAESAEAKKGIFAHIKESGIERLWANCDEAYFGVGSFGSPHSFTEALREFGAEASECIGDVLGHCFNAEGEFITTEISQRLVSIPLELLRKIKKRFVIAGGEPKAKALKGALKSGIITDLITDEACAASILA